MQFSTLALLGLPPALLVITAIVSEPPKNPTINPSATIQSSLEVPAEVQTFLRRACYDCHSSETRWPWYSAMPLASKLIQKDVNDGRSLLNFSEWKSTAVTPEDASAVLEETCEVVRRGAMPKPQYLYLHPNARPSVADVEMFCSWTKKQSAKLTAPAGIHE